MKTLPLLTGILLSAAMPIAWAHTPYLVPINFAPQGGETIALDAAFAETFFVPEAAFDHSRFGVTGPDGGDAAPDHVQVLKTRVVVEHTLPDAPGTYPFSPAPRHGALFRPWHVAGNRASPREPRRTSAAVGRGVAELVAA